MLTEPGAAQIQPKVRLLQQRKILLKVCHCVVHAREHIVALHMICVLITVICGIAIVKIN